MNPAHATHNQSWLAYGLARLDKIKPGSLDEAENKALARKILTFAEIDDPMFPSPSIWMGPTGAIAMNWACPFGERGSMEIHVIHMNHRSKFTAAFYRPGKPAKPLVCTGDWADSVRNVFGRWWGEPMGVSAAEVLALGEVAS